MAASELDIVVKRKAYFSMTVRHKSLRNVMILTYCGICNAVDDGNAVPCPCFDLYFAEDAAFLHCAIY